MSQTIQKKFSIVSIVLVLALIVTMMPIMSINGVKQAGAATEINKTMMQYFEWYVPDDGLHWNRVAERAASLADNGLSALWVPPTYKGAMTGDTGYGVYDMWDMGEFVIPGATSARTKYGNATQLRAAIAAAHNNGIAMFEDTVMNHRFSVESPEVVSNVSKCQMYTANRDATCGYYGNATVYTKMTFPQRAGKYDSYVWDSGSFNSADWDAATKTSALFKWRNFNWEVDTENGNYDFLMASNVDFNQSFVIDQLKKWSNWAMDEWGFDGFRYDAVKHIKFDAFTNKAGTGILDAVRAAHPTKNIFAVGEYWNRDLNSLVNYLDKSNWKMSLFDVPMHFKFFGIGQGGFDLRNLNSGNLANVNYGMNSVTFVDNHDTQYGQALLSPVADWAKPMGYAYILNRQEGLPMLFYADYYGYDYRPAGYSNGTLGSKEGIKGNLSVTINKLMAARTKASYGKQNDYFDDGDVVGFSREGVSDIANSGSATVLCDNANCGGGALGKWEFVGTANGGQTFKNVLGTKTVAIPSNGWAFFPAEGNAAVYVNVKLFNADGSISAVRSPMYVSATAAAAAPAPTLAPTPAPTATPAPVVAATPAPVALTNQTVTVYYKKTGFSNANIHYRNTKDLVWTVAPGKAMSVDATTGYFKVTVSIPDGSQLEACFNNGTTWDSNGGLNYKINGNSTVNVTNGAVVAGVPASLATTVATPAPAAAVVTVIATPVPTVAPAPTAAPVAQTSVTISFSLGNISTAFGDTVAVTGDYNGWVSSGANVTKLSVTGASVGTSNTWTGKISVGLNKTVNYKFIKISSTGAVTWESAYSGNRTIAVGSTNPPLVTASWNVK